MNRESWEEVGREEIVAHRHFAILLLCVQYCAIYVRCVLPCQVAE